MTGLPASLKLTLPMLRLPKQQLTSPRPRLNLLKRLLSLLLKLLRSSLLLKSPPLKSKPKQKSPHKLRDKKMLKFPDKEEAVKNGAVVRTADVEARATTKTAEKVAVDVAVTAVEEETAEAEPTTVDTTAVPSKMMMVS